MGLTLNYLPWYSSTGCGLDNIPTFNFTCGGMEGSQNTLSPYLDISDDNGVSVAVEKVLSTGVTIDDEGSPSLGIWKSRKHTFCKCVKASLG